VRERAAAAILLSFTLCLAFLPSCAWKPLQEEHKCIDGVVYFKSSGGVFVESILLKNQKCVEVNHGKSKE
jgi:hypothetical protein